MEGEFDEVREEEVYEPTEQDEKWLIEQYIIEELEDSMVHLGSDVGEETDRLERKLKGLFEKEDYEGAYQVVLEEIPRAMELAKTFIADRAWPEFRAQHRLLWHGSGVMTTPLDYDKARHFADARWHDEVEMLEARHPLETLLTFRKQH